MTTYLEPMPQPDMSRSSTPFASEEKPLQEPDLELGNPKKERKPEKERYCDSCNCRCLVRTSVTVVVRFYSV
ncbi:hypothetical protein RSOLAG22IIIB_04537 [Rhizoctonia solani]|uniref:Uncharacterized protein n=1 Tax=Rhizoctonia solani TaxID=456999 RepID=A0A0K6FYN3_9AGAM|nr:hypothetical protein RSOLAG22IIIB_04537 [Rhizoctonia solani]